MINWKKELSSKQFGTVDGQPLQITIWKVEGTEYSAEVFSTDPHGTRMSQKVKSMEEGRTWAEKALPLFLQLLALKP